MDLRWEQVINPAGPDDGGDVPDHAVSSRDHCPGRRDFAGPSHSKLAVGPSTPFLDATRGNLIHLQMLGRQVRRGRTNPGIRSGCMGPLLVMWHPALGLRLQSISLRPLVPSWLPCPCGRCGRQLQGINWEACSRSRGPDTHGRRPHPPPRLHTGARMMGRTACSPLFLHQ